MKIKYTTGENFYNHYIVYSCPSIHYKFSLYRNDLCIFMGSFGLIDEKVTCNSYIDNSPSYLAKLCWLHNNTEGIKIMYMSYTMNNEKLVELKSSKYARILDWFWQTKCGKNSTICQICQTLVPPIYASVSLLWFATVQEKHFKLSSHQWVHIYHIIIASHTGYIAIPDIAHE